MTFSFLVAVFWFIHEVKVLLFWVYLWQLKDYHIGRFIDHFRTEKGKKILTHPITGLKILLLFFLFVSLYTPSYSQFFLRLWDEVTFAVPLALFFLYIFEGGRTIKSMLSRRVLVPVFTRKVQFLLCILILCVAGVFLLELYAGFFRIPLVSLVLFDIFTPFIVSAVVLALQPFTVFARKRILKKAAVKRQLLKNLQVVGITGSYGKTTTKEFLAHILSKKFVVVKTPEHKNSEMGVAETILRDLCDEHQIFVCEMGAYGKGGIALLANMAKPDIGIIAGVNDQHLALFGSEVNLLSAEGGGELVAALPAGATVILNQDSEKLRELGPWLQLWNHDLGKFVWCSAKEQKDVWAEGVETEKQKIRFSLCAGAEKVFCEAPAIGEHTIESILLACACAKELGMSLQEIAIALKDAPVEASAMRIKQGRNGIHIIDSSYSANPDGVMAGLEYLKLWPFNSVYPERSRGAQGKNKKILVMPCLIELGNTSRYAHERIARKFGESCDYAIITTKDKFSVIQKGAKEGGMKEGTVFYQENARKIAEKIFEFAKEGDVVLLEGRVPAGLLSLLL